MAGALVAAVALVAWRLRARRQAAPPARVDPADIGLEAGRPGVAVLGFSSPYCLPCQRWEAALEATDIRFAKVDVAERPDLARRYGVRSTPLVLAVRLPGGEVLEAFDGEPREGEVDRLIGLAEGGLRRSV